MRGSGRDWTRSRRTTISNEREKSDVTPTLQLDRPAVFGQVDGIAVGIVNAKLGFTVGRPLVDAGCGVEFVAHATQGIHVFDLETEMVDAWFQLLAFDLALGADRDDG